KRVAGTVSVVSVVVEGFTVEFISTALGNSVGHATRGTSIFSGVVRRIYLKFTNGGLADNVIDTCSSAFLREESLVVIATVNCVVIKKPGDPAEADQTKRSVR